MDGADHNVYDYDQYSLNLTEANFINKAVWRKTYSFKSFYGSYLNDTMQYESIINMMAV